MNYRLEQPYQHAAFSVTHLTQEVMWTPEEKLAELDRSFHFIIHFFFKYELKIGSVGI